MGHREALEGANGEESLHYQLGKQSQLQVLILANMYIFFRASKTISDLLVCMTTMPLTVIRLVELPSWNYGDNACVLSRSD